jgi:formylglycine-generating enzyme required for sulfatase activity
VRGGSWYDSDVLDLRVSFRSGMYPGNKGNMVGFRCVRDLE